MPINAMENAYSLKGKNAIVTGGNKGIGKGIATAFAQQGANVAILARDEATSLEVIKEFSVYGGKYIFVKTDVGNIENCKTSTQAVIDQLGKIDILVNNAGIAAGGPFLDMDENMTDWFRVQSIDLNGVAQMCYFVGKHMKETGGGKVINISSNAGEIVNVDLMAPYAAAKAAVNRLTKSLAFEWGPYGINVNAIAPGFTWSNFSNELPEEAFKHLCSKTPTGRFGEAIEVGALAVYLASAASDQVTGLIATIDGGYGLAR